MNIKPAPHVLVSTPRSTPWFDLETVNALHAAVHELNGRIKFLEEQLAIVATAASVPIDTLAD
jgi:hypothetical protein